MRTNAFLYILHIVIQAFDGRQNTFKRSVVCMYVYIPSVYMCASLLREDKHTFIKGIHYLINGRLLTTADLNGWRLTQNIEATLHELLKI